MTTQSTPFNEILKNLTTRDLITILECLPAEKNEEVVSEIVKRELTKENIRPLLNLINDQDHKDDLAVRILELKPDNSDLKLVIKVSKINRPEAVEILIINETGVNDLIFILGWTDNFQTDALEIIFAKYKDELSYSDLDFIINEIEDSKFIEIAKILIQQPKYVFVKNLIDKLIRKNGS